DDLVFPCVALHDYSVCFRCSLSQVRAGRPVGRRSVTLRSDAVGSSRVLAAQRDVTILCHLRPNADALGSSAGLARALRREGVVDRKSTRLNSSHVSISYAVFCLKKNRQEITTHRCVYARS